jgi:hypothetical protein
LARKHENLFFEPPLAVWRWSQNEKNGPKKEAGDAIAGFIRSIEVA